MTSQAQKRLVETLEKRGVIRSPNVKRAFLNVRRELFVPEEYKEYAYVDDALPISHGQTISQPSVVAVMTEALEVADGLKILEIGSGSGYQTALLSELNPNGKIYSVERIPELAAMAKENLRKAGYRNIEIVVSDGSKGLPEKAPFDRIILTAACQRIPEPLVTQLRQGGVIVAPVGPRYGQDLVKAFKTSEGVRMVSLGFPVVFVPLIGEYCYKP